MEALGIGVASDCGGAGGGLLELALGAEEAGRRLAPIPVAETAAAARLRGRLGEKELIGPVLTGSTIVSLAIGPGPVEKQLLVDGAIADGVLAVEGSSLLYVTRPAGLARTPRPNFGGLPLARWLDGCERRGLAEGDSARTMFATALDEVRVLRAAHRDVPGRRSPLRRRCRGVGRGATVDPQGLLGVGLGASRRAGVGLDGVRIRRRDRVSGSRTQPSRPRRGRLHWGGRT